MMDRLVDFVFKRPRISLCVLDGSVSLMARMRILYVLLVVGVISLWLAETTASTSGRNLNGGIEKQMNKIIIIVLRYVIIIIGYFYESSSG